MPDTVTSLPVRVPPSESYLRCIDRPMSWRTRLMGMGSTGGLALALLGCALMIWQV